MTEFVQIGDVAFNPAQIVTVSFGNSQVWIDLVNSGQEDTDSCLILEDTSARAFKEWWAKQNVYFVNPAWYEGKE